MPPGVARLPASSGFTWLTCPGWSPRLILPGPSPGSLRKEGSCRSPLFLERAARQLAPGLIALIGAVSVLLYLLSQPVDLNLTPLESLPEEASLEYTVDSLRLSSEGGWIIDESN